MARPAQQSADHYHTTDLYYAAYLRVAGVPYVGETVEGRQVMFMFEDSTNMEDLKRDYFNGNGKVSALAYKREIIDLKAMTHEALRAAGRTVGR